MEIGTKSGSKFELTYPISAMGYGVGTRVKIKSCDDSAFKFKCDVGCDDIKRSWCNTKIEYCCQHEQVGCKDLEEGLIATDIADVAPDCNGQTPEEKEAQALEASENAKKDAIDNGMSAEDAQDLADSVKQTTIDALNKAGGVDKAEKVAIAAPQKPQQVK